MLRKRDFFAVILAITVFVSCKGKATAVPAVAEQHDAQLHYKGIGTIYIDKGDCQKLLKGDSAANKLFTCYRIVFIDSTQSGMSDEAVSNERASYYQYGIEQDWRAIHDGDSVSPAFMHVTNRLQKNRYEGVLVFELLSDEQSDTLFFNDARGIWGKQQFILTN